MIHWRGHLRIVSGRCGTLPESHEEIPKVIRSIQDVGFCLIGDKCQQYAPDPERLDQSYWIESPAHREGTKASIFTLLLPLIRHLGGVAIIQEAEGRQPIKYFGTDQDGTLLSGEALPLLARAIRPQIQSFDELTLRAMAGESDFVESFCQRSQLLAGYRPEEALQIFRQIPLVPDADELLTKLKQKRITREIITSNYSLFAQDLFSRFELDGYCASIMETEESGRWSGQLIPPIIDAQGKREYLYTRLQQLGLSPQQALCIGDGANDLPMLSLSGVGVLYCGAPQLIPLPWRFMHPYFGIDT